MESLKETFISVVDAFKERVRNPFIGAFLIAWLFYNWRALSFFIFSGKNIEKKIQHIDTQYSDFWDSVGFPFLIAAIYVVGMPYMHSGIKKATKWASKWTRDVDEEDKDDFLTGQILLADKEVTLARKRAVGRELEDLTTQLETANQKLEQVNKELTATRSQHLNEVSKHSERISELNRINQDLSDRLSEMTVMKEVEFGKAEPLVIRVHTTVQNQYTFTVSGKNSNLIYLKSSSDFKAKSQAIKVATDLKKLSSDRSNYLIMGGNEHAYAIRYKTNETIAISTSHRTEEERQYRLNMVHAQLRHAEIDNAVGLDPIPAA